MNPYSRIVFIISLFLPIFQLAATFVAGVFLFLLLNVIPNTVLIVIFCFICFIATPSVTGWHLAKSLPQPPIDFFRRWLPLAVAPLLWLLAMWLGYLKTYSDSSTWMSPAQWVATDSVWWPGPVWLLPGYGVFGLTFFLRSERLAPSRRRLLGLICLSLLLAAAISPSIASRHILDTDIMRWNLGRILPDDDGAVRIFDVHGDHDQPGWRRGLFHPESRPVMDEMGDEMSLRITVNWPEIAASDRIYSFHKALPDLLYVWPGQGRSQRKLAITVSHSQQYDDMFEAWENNKPGIGLYFDMLPGSSLEKRLHNHKIIQLPVAREALVFVTHADNPVSNITLEQVLDIYAGRLTNWKSLDGFREEILPFRSSYASTAEKIIKGLMKDAGQDFTREIKEAYDTWEGVVEVRRVHRAIYRNYPNSLGIFWRWAALRQMESAPIKILSVDGIYPNEENIRNGRYPLSFEIDAFTPTPPTREVAALLDWLRHSPEGERFIRFQGYVPLKTEMDNGDSTINIQPSVPGYNQMRPLSGRRTDLHVP
ncbi:hypothetical protein C4J81_14970 [Deltaproteobacteria bacterium Smac51]|nr:hypothetical protein C4J81_14970 [Deltaproteobacteria bacterium Smac51]